MADVDKNLRWWDRTFRYVFGLILVAWGIAGGPWWVYVGMYPLVTASFGFCPVYWILRIRPRRQRT
ncbi:MAG: DUF2892 domain-containing protein [Bdellovibrionales bacterium]